MRIFIVFVMTLALTAVSFGQDDDTFNVSFANPEFGSLEEIKDVTEVCVVVPDFEFRRKIVERIQKESKLKVLSSRKGCRTAILYNQREGSNGVNFAFGMIRPNTIIVGELAVFRIIEPKENEVMGTARLIWSKAKTQDWTGGLTFNKHPVSSTVGSFLKDFKKLR